MTLDFFKRATQLGSVVDRKFTIHNKMLFVQHALTLLKTTFFFFGYTPILFPYFPHNLRARNEILKIWYGIIIEVFLEKELGLPNSCFGIFVILHFQLIFFATL